MTIFRTEHRRPAGAPSGSRSGTGRSRIGAGLAAVALATVGLVGLTAAPAQAAEVTFGYTGGVQTWVVPDGVTSVPFRACGAQGGSPNAPYPNGGGCVTATIAVTPGETLQIVVGSRQGFNGGGRPGASGGNPAPFTGGGASDVRVAGDDPATPYSLEDRVLVGGGGGGFGGANGGSGRGYGGAGGGPDGSSGQGGVGSSEVPMNFGGEGGTTIAGGAGGQAALGGAPGEDGTFGQGGRGGPRVDGTNGGGGGGGGGGYYGGGGGGTDDRTPGAGGGGGSSYGPEGAVYEAGVQSGNGIVTILNRAPSASDDAYTTDEDTALTVPAPGVLGNDTELDGDALTAALVTGPAQGTVSLNADGSFTYTPNAGYTGADSFTYTVSDGTATSNTATVQLTVQNVNAPPVAVNDTAAVSENVPVTVAPPGVLGNDTDADGDALTAALATGPAHGTVTLDPNGSFTYTPNVDYAGTDSFTYTASDGTAVSAAATVTLTVSSAPPGNCTITGTAKADILNGTPGDDVICGLGGNDLIKGGGGNDTLIGGAGNDAIAGGDGNDRLVGGAGNDALSGGNGNDILFGGAGVDALLGGPGSNTNHGGPGIDVCAAPLTGTGCNP